GAKAVTTAVPIVFATGADPVRGRLVESLNRPTGNITGISAMNLELEMGWAAARIAAGSEAYRYSRQYRECGRCADDDHGHPRSGVLDGSANRICICEQ